MGDGHERLTFCDRVSLSQTRRRPIASNSCCWRTRICECPSKQGRPGGTDHEIVANGQPRQMVRDLLLERQLQHRRRVDVRPTLRAAASEFELDLQRGHGKPAGGQHHAKRRCGTNPLLTTTAPPHHPANIPARGCDPIPPSPWIPPGTRSIVRFFSLSPSASPIWSHRSSRVGHTS